MGKATFEFDTLAEREDIHAIVHGAHSLRALEAMEQWLMHMTSPGGHQKEDARAVYLAVLKKFREIQDATAKPR